MSSNFSMFSRVGPMIVSLGDRVVFLEDGFANGRTFLSSAGSMVEIWGGGGEGKGRMED